MIRAAAPVRDEEARRLLGQMDFTDAQRQHVSGLIDRWEDGR